MDAAVIGIGPGVRECERENVPGIMYFRIKYAIRAIWIPGRRAMIIAGPSPLYGIARVNVHGAGTEGMGIVWSDCHIRRRRVSEDGKK
jgi:hypothetical protein